MYRHYRARGLGNDEAMQRAQEKFALTDETVSHLVQIHDSSYNKLAHRLSAPVRTLGERTFLIILLLLVAVLVGQQLWATPFFYYSSSYTWLVWGILAAVPL